MDVVLSSGFLAFAAHAGFLRAVEERGIAVDGVCGTSSGALVGALWAAGLPAEEILERLTARSPLRWARLHAAPWTGAFSLSAVLVELRSVLPPTFADLGRPFAVGVAMPGRPPLHVLLASGPLPEAVAASCAVPGLFAPVVVGDRSWMDGGLADRTGLEQWRDLRHGASQLVHLVDPSRPGRRVPELPPDVLVVRSPRARARLWSLGDTAAAYADSRTRALTAFDNLRPEPRGDPGSVGPPILPPPVEPM